MAIPAEISDTTEEALAVQLDCLRQMTPQQRIQRMCAWSGKIRRMAFAAIKRRHPDLTENDVRLKFIALTYGESLADNIRQWQEERDE